jgi:hypothetical protein
MLELKRVTCASQLTKTPEASHEVQAEVATKRFVHAWVKRLVYADTLNSFGINSVNRAIFSAYLDLVHLGMQDQVEHLKEVAFEKAKIEEERYIEYKRREEAERAKLRKLQPISEDAQKELTLKRLEHAASLIRTHGDQLDEQELGFLKHYIFISYVEARDLGILEQVAPFKIIAASSGKPDKEHSPSKKAWGIQRKPKPLNPEQRNDLILRRLSRGVRLMNEYSDQLNESGVQLLKSMIFADYVEARKFKLKKKAQDIFKELNQDGE